jgi:hypothetical protein
MNLFHLLLWLYLILIFIEKSQKKDDEIVPPERVIKKLFTEMPHKGAFWIMDDGSKQGKGLYLNTYSFSSESIDRLLNLLQTKFELKCSIHFKENKPPRRGFYMD